MTIRPATADSAAPLLILDDEPQSEPRRTYHRTTRRERLEAKLEKRREWAESADRESNAHYKNFRRTMDAWPFGQPCHTQTDVNRLHKAAAQMDRSVEDMHRAEHHRSKAEGLARQLEKNIYSDDPDALENIDAKIETLNATRAFMKAHNAQARKEKWDEPTARKHADEKFPENGERRWCRYLTPDGLFQSYNFNYISKEVKRLESRRRDIASRQKRQAAADNAGGLNILKDGAVNVVTFSEKPPREIIDALKSAGYYWRNGSWRGFKELPEAVRNFQPDQN